MKTITINGNQFVASATEFFEEQPKRVNGHPTVSLLLFIHTPTSTYSWYPLTGESIANAVDTGVKKQMMPIGGAHIRFETRADGRIYLDPELPHFVDPNFDSEEVMNGTIPYLMKEKFGYDLDTVRISDWSKN